MTKSQCKCKCEDKRNIIKFNIKKSICKIYGTIRPVDAKTYGNNFSYCRICCKYMQYFLSKFCFCCGYKLSRYMRNRRSRLIVERYYRNNVLLGGIKKGSNVKTDILKNKERWEALLRNETSSHGRD